MGGRGAAPARHPDGPRPKWSGPTAAACLYALAALVMTWPLTTRLTTAIPWDLGDPLLNSWIVAWGADHLWRFVTGDVHALAGFWQANIFHPSPYALAYSEHLTPQALQVLPVWALTRNPVLCYNLLFLSTFILCGLGMYLLARELTGDARVALVAGLCYAFAPYRIGQYSHVQVLSSQWMPFALYGLRRYFDTGRPRALAAGTAALVAQGLSCGYYLLFFAPVAAAYVVFEIGRRRIRTGKVLLQLAVAGVVAAALTWPFIQPYLALRALEFPARSIAEVAGFSADVQSYATAHPSEWVWGTRLRAYPRPEGELFPGILVVLLAAVACSADVRGRWDAARDVQVPRWRRTAARLAATVALATGALLVAVILTGGLSFSIWGVRIRSMGLVGALLRAGAAVALLLALSRRARATLVSWLQGDTAWFTVALAAAALLSLGPSIRTGGRLLAGTAPYAWLYSTVPGFDGIRVPARLAMLVALCLSALAAMGLHRIARRTQHVPALLSVTAVLVLIEGSAVPLPLNAVEPPGTYAAPSTDLYPHGSAPPVYAAVTALPSDAVLLEMPVGAPAWDVRAVFYSTGHWRRLVNGYSGGFPHRYVATSAALSRIDADPTLAWESVRASGATHVIVHRSAYLNDADARVVLWLERHGAARVGDYGDDRLYAVRR